MGWHEHEKGLFEGTERFFRPTYLANLVSSWIPALEGVEAKLKEGARVADIGCGHGASTLLMAKRYPNSKFFGFDYHKPSIEKAREKAKEAGVADRVTFAVASAKDFPGKDYDLVAFFDCLHDMGDPVGAAKHVKKTLAKDGTWMIVEPFANDDAAANHNPSGTDFLFGFGDDLRALLAGAGGWVGPGGSGGAGADGGCGEEGRIDALSGRRRRLRLIWCMR